jgi:hypothetical protein
MFEDDRTRRQDQATAEAFADPRPGDRFQEMYSWWMVVVSAGPEGVKVMSGSGPVNLRRGRFPDGEIVEPFPERAEVRWYATAGDFRDAHRYGSIPGYDMMLADRGKVDVTGWLERAKSVPDAPTHPKPAAREPELPPPCPGDGEIPPELAQQAADAIGAVEGRLIIEDLDHPLLLLRPYLARIARRAS